MAFDLSKLSFLQRYLTSNAWVIADVIFVFYSLYNTIVHFRIGVIGTLFRFVGYILSYFITKWLLRQATIYLGIRDQMSLWILAIAIFIFFGYILYRNLRYFSPGPVSFLDSLVGAFYGIAESLFFLLVLNTTCVYVHQNGFGVPDWILVANDKKSEKDIPKFEKPEILYSLIKLGNQKGSVVLPVGAVNAGFEWIKSQFSSIVTDLSVTTKGATTEQAQGTVVVSKQ